MPVLVAPSTLGDLLKYELNANYCRETVTLKAGISYALGSVLGKVSVGSAEAAAKAGGNTGDGTLTLDATTPVLARVKIGIYTVRCTAAATNGGTFEVQDRDGFVLGSVAVGATFADDIKFTIAAGDTDFIVGDGFDVTIAASPDSGKYRLSPATGVDGSETAIAVLLQATDATDADATGLIVARGPVILSEAALAFDASVDDAAKEAAKKAELATAGIVVRQTA